jgi:hypothetical protein
MQRRQRNGNAEQTQDGDRDRGVIHTSTASGERRSGEIRGRGGEVLEA